MNVNVLSRQFFTELKQYNRTNFKTLYNADLLNTDHTVMKSFSSVITRFFIFCEKHPELSSTDIRVLYFKLKVDMVAKFFSEYPDTDTNDLAAFQTELRHYAKEQSRRDINGESTVEISNIGLASAFTGEVQQQP